MKVILLQDVPGTGKKGEVLNVSDGYARNFLFPRKWAMQANDKAVKEVERRKEIERRNEAERLKEAQDLASTLEGKTVVVNAKAGEGGRLYGSITSQEVADALKRYFGTEIDKRKIDLKESVRQLGESKLEVKLYPGVSANMILKVVEAK